MYVHFLVLTQATGCGKTHTISGTAEDPGLIYLTMQGLYERIAADAHEYETQVRLSYLEIYNETIRDLLSPAPTPTGPGLALREDAASKISVVGITEHVPASPEQVLEMITNGNRRRTQSPTEANAVSSRSHAVLQLNVMRRPRTAGTVEEVTSGSLNIIDLAGSERAAATNNQGLRMKEGANINRSLLALGSCISALCQGGRGRRHIPYRNSKLTRLLKFSLGGNCKTVMIACVSPSSAHYDETHNTLKYANQAKNIQTKVSRNLLHVDRHVAQYVQAIASLRAEVAELKGKLAERPDTPRTASAAADAELAEAQAALVAAAASAQTEAAAAAAADAPRYVAQATLAAVAARRSTDKSEDDANEHVVLAALEARCRAAGMPSLGAVPPLEPRDAPPIVRADEAASALFDAAYALHSAQLAAHTDAASRRALEAMVAETLAPRVVELLAAGARQTQALEAAAAEVDYACSSRDVSALAGLARQLRATAAEGRTSLAAVAGEAPSASGARMPLAASPRKVRARLGVDSPARRKSPRRRVLAPRTSVGRSSLGRPGGERGAAAAAPGVPAARPRASTGPSAAGPRRGARPTAEARARRRTSEQGRRPAGRPADEPRARASHAAHAPPRASEAAQARRRVDVAPRVEAEVPRAGEAGDVPAVRTRTFAPVPVARRSRLSKGEGPSSPELSSPLLDDTRDEERAGAQGGTAPAAAEAPPGPPARNLFQRQFLARADAAPVDVDDALLNDTSDLGSLSDLRQELAEGADDLLAEEGAGRSAAQVQERLS